MSCDVCVFVVFRARFVARTRVCNFVIFVVFFLCCVCMSFVVLLVLVYSLYMCCLSLVSKEVMMMFCDDDFLRIFSCFSYRRLVASRVVVVMCMFVFFFNMCCLVFV